MITFPYLTVLVESNVTIERFMDPLLAIEQAAAMTCMCNGCGLDRMHFLFNATHSYKTYLRHRYNQDISMNFPAESAYTMLGISAMQCIFNNDYYTIDSSYTLPMYLCYINRHSLTRIASNH